MLSAGLLQAQSEKSSADKVLARLASKDARIRYSAIADLKSTSTLPERVIRILIDYLDDLRGEYPGNTVAGEAAKILAEHPRQASPAVPKLLELLANTGGNGLPGYDAAEALTAISRPALEKHIAGLNPDRRKALAQTLIQNFRSFPRSITAELIGMLGPEAHDAVPVLEQKITETAKLASTVPAFLVLKVRSESTLRIIKAGWRVGESGYNEEMLRVDLRLGRPNPYASPGDRFASPLEMLADKMKKTGVRKAYILRKEDTFPFRLSDRSGLPLARLIQNTGHRLLYGDDNGTGKQLPNVPLVVLTRVAQEVYQSNHFPDVNPPYVPLVPDFAFVEIGANGGEPLDQAFKAILLKEGYRDDRLYEFWPSEWWPGKGKLGANFRIHEESRLAWIVLADGEVVDAVYMKR